MATEGSSVNQKQGVIMKCPSCGGALKAFASVCDMCGHELAGISANRTVTELVARFTAIEEDLDRAGLSGGQREKELVARRARLIRDFPIPNSREDLQSLIYFIHPKIQDNLKPDPNAEDWRVKFKEVLTLAKNAYKGDAKTRAEFEEIERSLNTTISSNLKTSARRSPLVAAGIGVVLVAAVVGIVSSQMDKSKAKQCEEKYAQGAVAEKARINAGVTQVLAKQKEKNYADALTALNQLTWDYKEACKVDEANQEKQAWETRKRAMIADIQNVQASEATQKKEEAVREETQKKAVAEQELTKKLTDKAKEAAVERKAATNKEW